METLNHIIIYNLVFSLVSNCCICSPCYMLNIVQMAMLHFNLNYICNKLFLCCFLNLINTQKPPNGTLTHLGWKKNKIIIIIDYYCFLFFHGNPIHLLIFLSDLIYWTIDPNFWHPMPSSIIMHIQNEWIESSFINLHPSPSMMLHLEACFPCLMH